VHLEGHARFRIDRVHRPRALRDREEGLAGSAAFVVLLVAIASGGIAVRLAGAPYVAVIAIAALVWIPLLPVLTVVLVELYDFPRSLHSVLGGR
jgi:hypothetical protein